MGQVYSIMKALKDFIKARKSFLLKLQAVNIMVSLFAFNKLLIPNLTREIKKVS